MEATAASEAPKQTKPKKAPASRTSGVAKKRAEALSTLCDADNIKSWLEKPRINLDRHIRRDPDDAEREQINLFETACEDFHAYLAAAYYAAKEKKFDDAREACNAIANGMIALYDAFAKSQYDMNEVLDELDSKFTWPPLFPDPADMSSKVSQVNKAVQTLYDAQKQSGAAEARDDSLQGIKAVLLGVWAHALLTDPDVKSVQDINDANHGLRDILLAGYQRAEFLGILDRVGLADQLPRVQQAVALMPSNPVKRKYDDEDEDEEGGDDDAGDEEVDEEVDEDEYAHDDEDDARAYKRAKASIPYF